MTTPTPVITNGIHPQEREQLLIELLSARQTRDCAYTWCTSCPCVFLTVFEMLMFLVLFVALSVQSDPESSHKESERMSGSALLGGMIGILVFNALCFYAIRRVLITQSDKDIRCRTASSCQAQGFMLIQNQPAGFSKDSVAVYCTNDESPKLHEFPFGADK